MSLARPVIEVRYLRGPRDGESIDPRGSADLLLTRVGDVVLAREDGYYIVCYHHDALPLIGQPPAVIADACWQPTPPLKRLGYYDDTDPD